MRIQNKKSRNSFVCKSGIFWSLQKERIVSVEIKIKFNVSKRAKQKNWPLKNEHKNCFNTTKTRQLLRFKLHCWINTTRFNQNLAAWIAWQQLLVFLSFFIPLIMTFYDKIKYCSCIWICNNIIFWIKPKLLQFQLSNFGSRSVLLLLTCM
jgi:hypothetical protein